jgi:hypothetical protein
MDIIPPVRDQLGDVQPGGSDIYEGNLEPQQFMKMTR